MGMPYSNDLRSRVLAAVDDGARVREVAELFRVSVSYILQGTDPLPEDGRDDGAAAMRATATEAGGS